MQRDRLLGKHRRRVAGSDDSLVEPSQPGSSDPSKSNPFTMAVMDIAAPVIKVMLPGAEMDARFSVFVVLVVVACCTV